MFFKTASVESIGYAEYLDSKAALARQASANSASDSRVFVTLSNGGELQFHARPSRRVAGSVDAGDRIVATTEASEALRMAADPLKGSIYLDGSRTIDLQAKLKTASTKYAISANPSDYIYEICRALTASVQNENDDCFEQSELLRFDTRLAKLVYQTFEGKPHHLNHSAADPFQARGVILDVSFNDRKAALEECPQCHAKTASVEARDHDGIRCRRCAHVVADRYVEMLIAIDQTKDRDFARHVKAGIFNATSMGCDAGGTTCNVCQNIARKTSEFCPHVKPGAKGKLFKRDASTGGAWRMTTTLEATRLLEAAGWTMTAQFQGARLPGVEIRDAHEKCHEVEFQEQSGVHRPADPTALTEEILELPTQLARAASTNPRNSMEMESALFAVDGRLRKLENHMKYHVVQIDGSPTDIHAGASRVAAIQAAMPDDTSHVAATIVEADDATAARLAALRKFEAKECDIVSSDERKSALPSMTAAGAGAGANSTMDIVADSTIRVPDNMEVQVVNPETGEQMDPAMQGAPGAPAQPGAPGAPGVPAQPGAPVQPSAPAAPGMGAPEAPMNAQEVGVLPPPAASATKHADEEPEMNEKSASHNHSSTPSATPWLGKHAGAFEVDVAASGVATVLHIGRDGVERPAFLVTAGRRLEDENARAEFGSAIVTKVAEVGIVGTIEHFNAVIPTKAASIADIKMSEIEGDPRIKDAKGDADIVGSGAYAGLVDIAESEKSANGASSAAKGEGGMAGKQKGSLSDIIEKGNGAKPADSMIGDEAKKPGDNAIGMAEGQSRDIDDAELGEANKGSSMSGEGEVDYKVANVANANSNRVAELESELENRVASASLEAAAKVEARLKKTHAIQMAGARVAALAHVEKAMRLAAQRMLVNDEPSPLKREIYAALTEERVVGMDSRKGEIVTLPMASEMATNHIETSWSKGHAEEIDALISRTSELLKHTPEYLDDAVADISKRAHGPSMVRDASVASFPDSGSLDAREAAAIVGRSLSAGVLDIAPSNSADVGASGGDAITGAFALTKFGRIITNASRGSN